MPKRKSVESSESAPVVAEPKKTVRKVAADKPKSPAGKAVHKHHTKKTAEPVVEAPVVGVPVVEMTVAGVSSPVVITREAIALRAYYCWESNGCPAGSQEQDWLQAEQDLLKLSQDR